MNICVKSLLLIASLSLAACAATTDETAKMHAECSVAYNQAATTTQDAIRAPGVTNKTVAVAVKHLKKMQAEEFEKAKELLGKKIAKEASENYRAQLKEEMKKAESAQPAFLKIEACRELNKK